MKPLDVARCRRGMSQITLEGPVRPGIITDAIADAIAAILRDPAGALTQGYIGVKNYSAFGDQREDHAYHTGPKHGSIIFRIGRPAGGAQGTVHPPLDDDAIYLIEAYRDFVPYLLTDRSNLRSQSLNLCDCIRALDKATMMAVELSKALTAAQVDSHEQEPRS